MMIKTTVQQQIDWLAQFGLTEDGGVTRLLYSAPWQQAQQAVAQRMIDGGLAVEIDAVGNVFGRVQGATDEVILTGSHVDTVVNGGKLDGAYGVIASMIAVTELYAQHGKPKKTLEVVSLCEEEGSRFPLTFWGSRSVVGQYSLAHMHGVADRDGTTLEAARAACGLVDTHIQPRPISRFVELHIEQGQVLEREQKDIGVVTHIVGQRRYTITICGESNHAGTTPMHYRQDALVAAASCILRFTQLATAMDRDFVATIGQMNISPNVPNVIAHEVKFTLDIRHYDEAIIAAYCEKIFLALDDIARAHEVTYTIEQWLEVAPVAMDTHVNEWVKTYLQAERITYCEMRSGAGHDAQVFGQVVPTTLLFVPSARGISHSPKEHTDEAHLQQGIHVLKALLYKLAY